MRTPSILLAGAALAAAAFMSAGAQANLVTNGSFENGSGSAGLGGFVTLGAGNPSITGWTIGPNNIDWINNYWLASNGTHSLDMNGDSGASAVSQTIATVAGAHYNLSFDLAGNPDLGSLKYLTVFAGATSHSYTFDSSGHDRVNMGWVGESFGFTATGASTLIKFQSGSTDNCCWGPALDNVSVTGGVPELATWAMMIIGFGGVALRMRRHRDSVALTA